jgi:hypothetical protein
METNTDLVEAAERSTVVRQLRELTTWIGDGRKLTQTGRITLGDARALVDLLGTEDRVDPEIGGKVFKTTSSEELRGLIKIVEWAKAAGLLRTVKSRIVPVKKNLAVINKPLELWELAFDAFDQLGEAICVTWMGPALMAREFQVVVPWLLAQLYAGPVKVADLYQEAWELVTRPYVLDAEPAEHLRSWRNLNDSDLRHVLTALEQLGAVRLTREDREIRTAELPPLGLRTMRRRRGAPEHGDRSDDEVVLSDLVKRAGKRFEYEYDFGDSWQHDLVVEEILEAERDVVYRSCVAGEGACPPEDSGGIGGYFHLRDVLADPEDQEHEDMLDWLGLVEPEDLDPAAFDLAEVNRALAAV